MLALALLLGSPAVAQAQLIDVRVHVPLPTIRFEVAPPLVVVSEGLQVVPDYQEEVFFVDSWYWHRSGGHWYRTRDYRGGWVVVERRHVPVMLVGIPAGKYKHFKHGRAHRHHPGKGVAHHRHRHGDGKGRGNGRGHGHGKHKGKWK